MSHGDIHFLITICHGELHIPVVPALRNGIRGMEVITGHFQHAPTFHLGTIVYPIAWPLDVETIVLSLDKLRIAPQMTTVLFGDKICPPVIGGDTFAFALMDIQLTGPHDSALVAAMLVGLTFIKRSVGRITAFAHLHNILCMSTHRHARSKGEEEKL